MFLWKVSGFLSGVSSDQKSFETCVIIWLKRVDRPVQDIFFRIERDPSSGIFGIENSLNSYVVTLLKHAFRTLTPLLYILGSDFGGHEKKYSCKIPRISPHQRHKITS